MLVQDAMVYIPLRKTLQCLLLKSDIRSSVNHVVSNTLSGVLRDICDGALYQKHSIISCTPRKIQITAYYDEIELCSSHT